MRRAVFLLLMLAACGTPQERCISRETRDLRVLDRLIAETQGNLRRGYALEEIVVYRTVWVQCPTPPAPAPVEGQPAPPAPAPRMCRDEVRETDTRPKAIDLRAESQKLVSMQDKRRSLLDAAQPGIAQCRAEFPE